jgi:hypothetical protein
MSIGSQFSGKPKDKNLGEGRFFFGKEIFENKFVRMVSTKPIEFGRIID